MEYLKFSFDLVSNKLLFFPPLAINFGLIFLFYSGYVVLPEGKFAIEPLYSVGSFDVEVDVKHIVFDVQYLKNVPSGSCGHQSDKNTINQKKNLLGNT